MGRQGGEEEEGAGRWRELANQRCRPSQRSPPTKCDFEIAKRARVFINPKRLFSALVRREFCSDVRGVTVLRPRWPSRVMPALRLSARLASLYEISFQPFDNSISQTDCVVALMVATADVGCDGLVDSPLALSAALALFLSSRAHSAANHILAQPPFFARTYKLALETQLASTRRLSSSATDLHALIVCVQTRPTRTQKPARAPCPPSPPPTSQSSAPPVAFACSEPSPLVSQKT